jgi:hypothetical protein
MGTRCGLACAGMTCGSGTILHIEAGKKLRRKDKLQLE